MPTRFHVEAARCGEAGWAAACAVVTAGAVARADAPAGAAWRGPIPRVAMAAASAATRLIRRRSVAGGLLLILGASLRGGVDQWVEGRALIHLRGEVR